jgi:hypothetical protein
MPRITGSFTIGTDKSQVKGGFHDLGGTPRHGWEAIFPIVQIKSEIEWMPIGTGFFISNNGMFATAKHVIVDREGAPLRSLFGIQFLHETNEIVLREIVKMDLHCQADVGIGFLFDKTFAERGEQTVNKCLGLTVKIPEAGERIVTYSFPQSAVFEDESGRGLSFESSASKGAFEQFYPSGRDRVLLPGPCIRTSMPLAPGSSGGPVVFGTGFVFGINSTGFDGTDISYLSPVSSLLELAAHNVRLLDGTVHETIKLPVLVEMGLIFFDRGATTPAVPR